MTKRIDFLNIVKKAFFLNSAFFILVALSVFIGCASPFVSKAEAAIAATGTDRLVNLSGSPFTTTHDLVAGSNRMVMVSVGYENASSFSVSSVTYGGVVMTDATIFSNGSGPVYGAGIWYLLESQLPSNGTKTVSLSTTGTPSSLSLDVHVSEYTGVLQDIPEYTTVAYQASGTTISTFVMPSSGAWVMSVLESNNPGGWTHGQSQYEAAEYNGSSTDFALAELRGASGSTTLSSTFGGTVNYLIRLVASFGASTSSNAAPTLSISQPDGVSDSVVAGNSYNVTYSLADSDDVVTAAFYYDTNNSGLDGTALSGACATAAEGSGATCSWNTTGVPAGNYYIYGITNDGVNGQVSAYSPGVLTVTSSGGGSGNIDGTDHYAWSDTVGWIDFLTTGTVSVSAGGLEGYAQFGPSGGPYNYLSLDCATGPTGSNCTVPYGVTNDANGNLSGWAWSDKIGWVSFDCHNPETGGTAPDYSCAQSLYQVKINAQGEFTGWAWNDIAGWISFNCNQTETGNQCATSNYKVKTTWTSGPAKGELESGTFDTQVTGGASFNYIVWRGQLNNGRVAFQFATSNCSNGATNAPTCDQNVGWGGVKASGDGAYLGPGGTSDNTDTYISGGPDIPSGLVNQSTHNNRRYFRYKVFLETDTAHSGTPVITDVIVNWSP